MTAQATLSLLPQVLAEQRESTGARLDLRIPEDLEYFPGHFSSFAVVPGVVQIHWAVHFGRGYFPEMQVFDHMEVVKFRELMLPGSKATLYLDFNRALQRLKFTYQSPENEFSTGRIYFRQKP